MTRVAIAGLGTVGRVVAEYISKELPKYTLTRVSANRTQRAREFLSDYDLTGVSISGVGELADDADIVVECAPASLFREIAEPVVESGKTLIVLSAGALLDGWDLVERADNTGARIHIPSGAFLGLDAVQGVACGQVDSVRMTTRKPASGLRGAPYLDQLDLDLDNIAEAKRIFHGSVRDAISGFPANLNVAVALALSGIGPDRTEIDVWVDPHVSRNVHNVMVESQAAHLDFTIENVPTENPATGRLTALSVVALLRKLSSSVAIGT